MNRGTALSTLLVATVATGAAAELQSFDCVFSSYCAPEEGCADTKFELRFERDTTTGQAVIIGNNGIANVRTHLGDRAISFSEMLSSGAVQLTTVNLIDNSSVHSRHTIVGVLATPIYGQYYGTCQIEGASS